MGAAEREVKEILVAVRSHERRIVPGSVNNPVERVLFVMIGERQGEEGRGHDSPVQIMDLGD